MDLCDHFHSENPVCSIIKLKVSGILFLTAIVTGCIDFKYIPTKKETHHLELFISQEDHKGYASLVCISAKVCQVLLRHTSFAMWRQKCVKENWSRTKWGSNLKVTRNKRFYNALLLDKFKQ